MHRNFVYQIFVVIFLSGLLVASCSPAINQPIIIATSQEINSPAASTITPEPSTTASMQPIQKTKTQTSTPSTFVTDTPDVCPPFEFDKGLPDPDIPENYIGYHLNPRELPPGLEYMGGALLVGQNQQYDLAVTELGWHENRQLFLLVKLICHDESGYPYFEIVDAFATPPLSGNETDPWVCFEGETQLHFRGGLGLDDESVPKETIGDFQGQPFTETLYLYDIDFDAQQFISLDVDGVKCLAGGGRDADYDTDIQMYHPGVDVGNQLGGDIYACAPGVVIYADYINDMGYTVIIQHDLPYGSLIYSIYGHLGTKDMTQSEAIFVKEGQFVDSDTRIGVMGNTVGPISNGEVTDPHLHFEVRTSLNVNLEILPRSPLKGMQWWMNQDGGKTCSPWTDCWLDLGLLYGYDPSYDPNVANGN